MKNIKTDIAAPILITIAIGLSGCGGGSDTFDEEQTMLTPADDKTVDNQQAPSGPSQGDARNQLIGTWDWCDEALQITITFTEDRVAYDVVTYHNVDCTGTKIVYGFEAEDDIPVWSGSYEVTGTSTTDSGLIALNLDILWDTYYGNNWLLFPDSQIIEMHYDIVYTGVEGSLLFSSTFSPGAYGNARPVSLNLEHSYFLRD